MLEICARTSSSASLRLRSGFKEDPLRADASLKSRFVPDGADEKQKGGSWPPRRLRFLSDWPKRKKLSGRWAEWEKQSLRRGRGHHRQTTTAGYHRPWRDGFSPDSVAGGTETVL